jgi:serine protease
MPVLVGAAAALVTACGGGGGGGSSVAPSTPTPAPTFTGIGPLPASCAPPAVSSAAGCTYTFQSNQAGIQVFLDNVLIGTTGANPISTTPPFSLTPHTVSFGSTGYSVTLDQGGATPNPSSPTSHTIFYNAAADTGSIAMSGNQSSARSAQALSSPETRRSIHSASRAGGVVPDKVYVRYDSAKLGGRSIAQIESDAGTDRAFDVLSSVAAVRGRVLHVRSGDNAQNLTARLRGEAAVVGVYPLHYRVPLSVPASPATRQTPNDPYFVGANVAKAVNCNALTSPQICQWDMRQMRADYAWYYTHGVHAKIAVLDTGADLTHPDLLNQIAFQATTAGTNGVVAQGVGAGSPANQSSTNQALAAAQDTNGHGTNVAGIANAETNDGVGFSGVGYGAAANLYIYRIFPPATTSSDEQSADTGDEATAINDAVARGVDVINLSLGAPQADSSGTTGFDQTEHDAVEAAIAAGVTVVAAAGNESAPSLDFPAAYDGVISVGATSLADGTTNGSGVAGGSKSQPVEYVATYANAGPGLSVVAPGGDPQNGSDNDDLHWIFNASTTTANFPSDQCSAATSPDVCKALFAGTSQATPHVAGSVLLVQSARVEAGLAKLSPAAMKTLLEGTADNINDSRQGHGRVNVLRAIESTLGYSLTLPNPVSSSAQFVAFAYTNSGAVNAAPAIANVYYLRGVPVAANGTFRIADIDPSKTTSFRIGVWLDANGDGKVDAGDQFGAAVVTCTATTACHPGTITVNPISSANFSLP